MTKKLRDITKTDLRNYFDKKFKERQNKIKQRIDDIINGGLDPLLDSYLDLTDLQQKARAYADALEYWLMKQPFIVESEWAVRYEIQNTLRYACVDKRIEWRDRLKRVMRTYIENPTTGTFDFYDESLNNAIKSLQPLVAPLKKELNDLITLQAEINTIIANHRRGYTAYKELVSLGVDLSDFEFVETTALAPVKLSVDPCLINGTCGEVVADAKPQGSARAEEATTP